MAQGYLKQKGNVELKTETKEKAEKTNQNADCANLINPFFIENWKNGKHETETVGNF